MTWASDGACLKKRHTEKLDTSGCSRNMSVLYNIVLQESNGISRALSGRCKIYMNTSSSYLIRHDSRSFSFKTCDECTSLKNAVSLAILM